MYKKNHDSIVEVIATQGLLDSSGSGVVVSDDGKILTNFHVISMSDNFEEKIFETIQVRLPSEEIYYDVEVIKIDPNKDLALLQILDFDESMKFNNISINDKDNLMVGDVCYAIGNVNSLSISMSKGIISNTSIAVEMNGYTNSYIQSNIDIAKGSSGGALVDEYGNLIGMTTLRLKDVSGNTAYGFAYSIKINDILDFLEELEY